jgi:hypothetical protein
MNNSAAQPAGFTKERLFGIKLYEVELIEMYNFVAYITGLSLQIKKL